MAALFDTAHFNHMTGGDRALQGEVIGLFRGQVAAWNAALGQGAGWRDAAHTIKGSARGIGLFALAEACEAAEAAPDVEAAPALTRLRSALDAALAALEQFAASAA